MAEIDSDLTLRRWKPSDPERPPGLYSVKCENARGLYARTFETGAITWVFRFKIHGKSRQMALGPYPAITLAAAREKARDAYGHVKAGRDPVELHRAADQAQKADAAGKGHSPSMRRTTWMNGARLSKHQSKASSGMRALANTRFQSSARYS